jgi:hypothetical protein
MSASVSLFQMLWFCKLYPIERVIWHTCPEKDGLPRAGNGQRATAMIYSRIRRLYVLMDDMNKYDSHARDSQL